MYHMYVFLQLMLQIWFVKGSKDSLKTIFSANVWCSGSVNIPYIPLIEDSFLRKEYDFFRTIASFRLHK